MTGLKGAGACCGWFREHALSRLSEASVSVLLLSRPGPYITLTDPKRSVLSLDVEPHHVVPASAPRKRASTRGGVIWSGAGSHVGESSKPRAGAHRAASKFLLDDHGHPHATSPTPPCLCMTALQATSTVVVLPCHSGWLRSMS